MTWKFAPAAALATLLLVGCEPIAETTDWDTDADNIGYDEWAPGFYDSGFYEAWDADGDALMSETEWVSGLGDRFGTYDVNRWGMYSEWDRDRSGYLDDIEFSSGVFENYDLDGDSLLVGEEFTNFDSDWL